jgi:hypothetical protein
MATLNRDQLLQVNAVARQYQAVYDEGFSVVGSSCAGARLLRLCRSSW